MLARQLNALLCVCVRVCVEKCYSVCGTCFQEVFTSFHRLEAHLELLKANFTIVGDNGEGDSATEEELIKQSDNSYVLWSSGRQGCNSMIIQMKVYTRCNYLPYTILTL